MCAKFSMKTRCKRVKCLPVIWCIYTSRWSVKNRSASEERPESAVLSLSIFFLSVLFLLISSLIMLRMESDIDRYELSEIRSGRCAGKQITPLLIHKCRDERLQQNHLKQTDTPSEKERELNTFTKEI